MKLLLELNQIGYDMDPTLDKREILSMIIERTFSHILLPENWVDIDNAPKRFGFGGVQNMILDIHLTLRLCDQYISEVATESANKICENGLRAYFASETDLTGELKLGDWYEERVNSIMEQIADLYVGLI
jgi:hypothetical protein